MDGDTAAMRVRLKCSRHKKPAESDPMIFFNLITPQLLP